MQKGGRFSPNFDNWHRYNCTFSDDSPRGGEVGGYFIYYCNYHADYLK